MRATPRLKDGKEITTVEGLANDKTLGAMQAAFVEHDAFQCGYCTPGQLCAATALVREFAIWKNTEVTVTHDGGELRGRMHDVIVANGRWHGGGMKLAPDAVAELNGVTLARRQQHLDTTTRLIHARPHGTSRQEFRNVVDDRAHAVFQGSVTVAPAG